MKRSNRKAQVSKEMTGALVSDSQPSTGPIRLVLSLFVALVVSVGGCKDRFTTPEPGQIGHLSLAAAFPEGATGQAVYVDAWRVQVTRIGEGVIAENQGSINPTQSSVGVEFVVDLNSSCETMAVRVDLSRSGEVWFLSNDDHEICTGATNEIQVVQLQWVRPPANVNPQAMDFTVQERKIEIQSLAITYEGVDGLAWTAWVRDGDVAWLSLQPSGGATQGGQPADVQVTVDTRELDPGQYSADIVVAGEGFPDPLAEIPVTLEVTAGPGLGLSTTSLSFVATEGLTPDPQTFAVTNKGGGTLIWTAVDNADWLELDPLGGSVAPGKSQTVTVSATPAGLSPGQHVAAITVSGEGAGNSPQTVAVSLTKVRAPEIGLSAKTLSFTALEGTSPVPQLFTVSNAGGGLLNWSASDDVGWLSLEPNTGALGAGLGQWVTATVSSVGLEPGDYSATVTISDPTAVNSPRSVVVTLTLDPRVPPTISDFVWEELQVNDTTCGNLGTRFEFNFGYSDPEGDVLIAGDSLAGKPIELVWWFRPNGNSGSTFFTGAVDGTGFSGSATFQMCIAYQPEVNTSIDLTITLMDAGNRQSNALTVNVPRPDGGNSPPAGVASVMGGGGGA